MSKPWSCCLAVLLAVATFAQPVMAAPPAAAVDDWVVHGRTVIAGRLMDFGRSATEAEAAAAALTLDDLRVLLANPAMMQPAGQTMSRSLIIGIILIAVLIAIAGSSDGFVSIN